MQQAADNSCLWLSDDYRICRDQPIEQGLSALQSTETIRAWKP